MARHRPQDHFGHRARAEGYPARSVYKLQEIDRRVKLLRRGDRVLDLGAAPGSFCLYVADRVGPTGRVLAVDLAPITIATPANVELRTCDVMTTTPEELGGARAFDVVLSDMAPKTTGQRHRDQFVSYELYMRALELAAATLSEGGRFVGKIFEGGELPDARRATQAHFTQVKTIKPDASRSESYEIFLVGLGRK